MCFILGRHLDNFLYGPKCRIVAFSVPKGLQIILENVVIKLCILNVSHIPLAPTKRPDFISRYLFSLFYEIPCETKGEDRPCNEDLFPDSKHKLINTTFNTQDDLIKAWEIVDKITVKVEYRGPTKRLFPTYRSLHINYIIFLDALKDVNGKNRELKAFKELN